VVGNLPESLTDSLSTEAAGDLLVTLGDTGFDAAVSSGALDGVPIFGIATGLWRAGREIQHELFVRKVLRFLSGLSQASQSERDKFITQLDRDGKKQKFGEAILLILDRIDDATKPEIVGRIMSAHIQGQIGYDVAMRLAAIVARVYGQDLDFLKRFVPGVQRDMYPIADALFSAGLLRNAGLDGGTLSDALSSGTIYELNEYGELLIKYGLA
jgi:hypothetical protein